MIVKNRKKKMFFSADATHIFLLIEEKTEKALRVRKKILSTWPRKCVVILKKKKCISLTVYFPHIVECNK